MKAVSPDVLKALGGTTTWKNLARLQLATDIYIYTHIELIIIYYIMSFLAFLFICNSNGLKV